MEVAYLEEVPQEAVVSEEEKSLSKISLMNSLQFLATGFQSSGDPLKIVYNLPF